jgi:prepilin-type N-terminal cleavage/methylation domain-containing protein
MNRGHKRGDRGFSAIELLIVISVIFVLAGIALPQVVAMKQTFQGNSAANDLMSRLRSARETAIASRRYIQVSFVGNNQIQFFQVSPNGAPAAPLYDIPATIASGGQYLVFSGVPDTPMQFGNSAPIYIDGQSGGPLLGMYFTPSGAFVSASNFQPISGTVFIGLPNQKNTAHAVTIVGGTGRVRLYFWNGGQWIE